MKDHLKIDSVFLEFGERKILRGVNLNLELNQIIGILGRNGSGKSCFLKIMTGQMIPQHKYISHNGIKLEHLFKKKGLINYLPQHEFHPKSVRINEFLQYYEIDKKAFLERYPFFQHYQKSKFSKLSGGQRRLLETLLVLESKSKYTLLDEPFTHIMPRYIDLVKDAIQKGKQKKGILISDHQYKNVLEVSDKTYLLKDGKMQLIKNEAELRDKGYIF